MVPSLHVSSAAIASFFRKWGIGELAVFGSALREDFGAQSDIDFLMTMPPGSEYSWEQYLRMKNELEQIVGRKVDLLDRQVVENSKNWIRRKHILSTCERLYAQG